MNSNESCNHTLHELNITLTSISSNDDVKYLPCNGCTLCCQLLTPNLTPDEISSGKYPLSFVNGEKGPVVVMYKNPTTGGCGMFKEGKCSIYNDRPIACRQFDCFKHWTNIADKYPQEAKQLKEHWKKYGFKRCDMA